MSPVKGWQREIVAGCADFANWVRIGLGDTIDADHHIDADERLRVAMARQWSGLRSRADE